MYYNIKYRVHPTIAFGLIYCIMFHAGRKMVIYKNGVVCIQIMFLKLLTIKNAYF